MNATQVHDAAAIGASGARTTDMKLEVVVIPVSDVDRAAAFYGRLGWKLAAPPPDLDTTKGGGRVLQFTPPGSPCSIIFGDGVTPSAPGSAQLLFLVVPDIEAARTELIGKGVEASEVFHDAGGGYNFFDPRARARGPDPKRRSYASFVTFSDPDGNLWLVQEITTRFPGRLEPDATRYASAQDLAAALRRAAAAHGEYEKRTGAADPDWPDWYAAYMAAEQSGAGLPS
jgi:catechol 2,3-dioxygenase-like lactoylglutathione lyase family enzyme